MLGRDNVGPLVTPVRPAGARVAAGGVVSRPELTGRPAIDLNAQEKIVLLYVVESLHSV